jgi:hypothetical protein
MQRDLVVILYGIIYNQYKTVKYKIANIIKLSVLGTVLSSFIYRRWVYGGMYGIHNTKCVLTCESLLLTCNVLIRHWYNCTLICIMVTGN